MGSASVAWPPHTLPPAPCPFWWLVSLPPPCPSPRCPTCRSLNALLLFCSCCCCCRYNEELLPCHNLLFNLAPATRAALEAAAATATLPSQQQPEQQLATLLSGLSPQEGWASRMHQLTAGVRAQARRARRAAGQPVGQEEGAEGSMPATPCAGAGASAGGDMEHSPVASAGSWVAGGGASSLGSAAAPGGGPCCPGARPGCPAKRQRRA